MQRLRTRIKHFQLKSTSRSVTAKYRWNKQCSIITYSSSQPILFDSVNIWLVFLLFSSIYNGYYMYIVYSWRRVWIFLHCWAQRHLAAAVTTRFSFPLDYYVITNSFFFFPFFSFFLFFWNSLEFYYYCWCWIFFFVSLFIVIIIWNQIQKCWC